MGRLNGKSIKLKRINQSLTTISFSKFKKLLDSQLGKLGCMRLESSCKQG